MYVCCQLCTPVWKNGYFLAEYRRISYKSVSRSLDDFQSVDFNIKKKTLDKVYYKIEGSDTS